MLQTNDRNTSDIARVSFWRDSQGSTLIFYSILSLLLISYSFFQITSILNLCIMIMVVYVCLSNAYKNYILIIFILPSLDIFLTESSSLSFVTVVFLIAFLKHIINRINTMQLSLMGLFAVLVFMMYEIMHIYQYNTELIPSTIRWAILFFYASLIIIDLNFKLDFRKVVHFFIAGIILSSICGYVLSLSTPLSDHSKTLFRFEGVGGDPNGFGMMVLLASLFLVNIYLTDHKPKRIYIYIFVGLIILGLTTLSRSYLITLAIVVIFFFLYSFLTRRTKLLHFQYKMILFSLGVFLIFLTPILQIINVNIDRITTGSNMQEMTGSRSLLLELYWQAYINSSWLNIFVGKGITGYLNSYDITIFGKLAGPHNTYLELLVAGGIIGVMLFLFYLLSLYKSQSAKSMDIRPSFISYLPLICMIIFLASLQSIAKYNTYFYLTMVFMNLFYGGQQKSR